MIYEEGQPASRETIERTINRLNNNAKQSITEMNKVYDDSLLFKFFDWIFGK